MCRLAAYLGPAIPLQQLLLQPSHSLYRQAREPKELIYAKLNADGYGFGWYFLRPHQSYVRFYRNQDHGSGTIRASFSDGLVRCPQSR